MDDVSPPRRRRFLVRHAVVVMMAVAILQSPALPARGEETDIAVVPLFNGEDHELLNRWGGGWGVGNSRSLHLQSHTVSRGKRGLCVELGRLDAGHRRYVQCFASGFGRHPGYCQTRNLARYERLRFRVRSATPATLEGLVQVKDYRDSLAHRALYRYTLTAGKEWETVDVPLRPGGGWQIEGEPDLARVLTVDFMFESAVDVAEGRVYLDDLELIEPGGPAQAAAAPLAGLVERLARRQWDALWSARSRVHGMLPSNSYQATDAGLNVTAAVLWMLPAAVRHGWVPSAEATAYVETLTRTLGQLLDRAKHLPPRNVDWVTLQPSMLPEESSVDAAFVALALHQYKSLDSTPPSLRAAIDRTQERFNFAAFASPTGWRMAYRYATSRDKEGMVGLTYDGYTGEADLIAVAAHLARRHHVPIETCWNTDVYRVRAEVQGQGPGPLVHALSEYRAPFTQALWNLFVDVRHRGKDHYPDPHLAVNPWQNFVQYQQAVMARLDAVGRRCLVQPDAGDDGSLGNYRQFSAYEDFGQNELFMPWSAAFALLAGADGAEDALRHLLGHRLHGPLGLADSAQWATGAAGPRATTARHDFWNTALSTMALLEWLDGPSRLSRSFAALPEVQTALDRVFLAPPESLSLSPPITSLDGRH